MERLSSAPSPLQPRLIIVDHIHFQYNGFLLGVLLLSVAFLRRNDALGDVLGGLTFAILLMLKHIFAYCAPLYFVYLLRHYCFVPVCAVGSPRSVGSTPQTSPEKKSRHVKRASDLELVVSSRRFSPIRLAKLGSVVAATFAACIGPVVAFADGGPIKAVGALVSRLAPVGRGLTHAYWAPNVWALYNLADKAALISLRKLGANVTLIDGAGATTGGLVGQTSHAILPSVPPAATAILVLLAMLPALFSVWHYPSPRSFTHALVYCTLCAFMLGYHVHEKAILMVIVPLTMAACDSATDARLFLLLSWTGQVSLLPLLFTPDVAMLKPCIMLLYGVIAYTALDYFILESRRAMRIRAEPNGGGVWLWFGDKVYLTLLAGVYMISEIGVPIFSRDSAGTALIPLVGPLLHKLYERYPFFPLMLTSTYCAVGMLHCWGLALKQLKRKQSVVRSYQQSPRTSPASVARGAKGASKRDGRIKTRSSGSFDFDMPAFALDS